MSSIHKLEAGWAPQMRQQITSSFVSSQLKFAFAFTFAFAWSDIVLKNEEKNIISINWWLFQVALPCN